MEQLTMEQFDELLTNAVKKAMEGMTAVDRKFGVFPTDEDGDQQGLTKEERAVKFLKSVWFGKAEDALKLSQRSLTEGTDTAGGYLVPEEFQAEVLRLIPEYGIARKVCRVVPMTRDKQNWPKAGSTGVTAYWVNEAAAITESSPTFGQVQLDSKKLAGLAALSNELVADANVDVLNYLYQLFAEQFAYQEDYQWLRGTGSPITGVIGSSGVNTVTMGAGETNFSDISIDDLVDLIAAIPASAEQGAAFFFHKKVLAEIRKLKDTNGQPVFQSPAGNTPGTIYGYPYYTTDVMPGTSAADTAFIVFGSGRWTLFGDRKQITVDISRDATIGSTNLYAQDMQALRMIERIDIEIIEASAYAILKTAAA